MSAGSSSDVRPIDRAEQVRRVILDFARRRGGPDPVSQESIVAEFPELMPDLALELEKLRRIHGAFDEVDDARCERAIIRLEQEWDDDLDCGELGENDHDGPCSGSGTATRGFSGLVPGQDSGTNGNATPARIGRYRLRHLLGEGAFGRVYLAWDEQLAREVAVKIPHAHQVADPKSLEAYLAEARAVARLDHPSIVPVYDVGRTPDDCCYVVSKWIRGSDLRLRTRRERLPKPEAVRIVIAVAEALDHAHRHGLVHRDIKPANILLDSSGAPYVGDFGLALSEPQPGPGRSFAGTPAYMSPEQARGEAHRVDGRSDIFSLGVVLYELITGRKPFDSESHEELFHRILWAEPVPPCQLDATIEPELERICLKALSKRAANRYHQAGEMASDLRHYLDLSARRRILQASSTGGGLVLAEAPCEPPPKIVPKGLRPFDANDSKSFLALVPGPRDRDGLPESIRQWKVRIENQEPEESFAVGVMYGPSGCGKSSLVRAGLLPRLSTRVHAVYVEAAADDTEARIQKKLLQRYPELPRDAGLVECLAALRCGCGPVDGAKLLLVIDQFEQWLHGRPEADRRLLVQALRHCDGPRLQCLVLVRDEFWLALSRFMTELEVDLIQHLNSALVDLFEPAHARKVLAEFGRAFGQLPDDLGQLSSLQQTFLQRAVDGLIHEDKVVPARLALFAEMVKGKPWTPATLRDVGGAAGVGVAFLEETFSSRAGNPRHRIHEQAARTVLKALLPEGGSELKGRVRSYPELLDISGYGEKPRAFKELMRILDGETRLLTPVDPEVVGAAGVPPHRILRYYQLTHDYLVPSLREWLTRKQKSTRAGRSELRLASRAAIWNAHPERRQLPSLWEWINIRLLTRSDLWSEPQRRMMRTAAKHHALTAGLLAAIVLAVLFSGLEVAGVAKDVLMQFRARSAAVWMAVGYDRAVWPLLRYSPDATLRTRVIHSLGPLGMDPETLLSRLGEQEEVSIRRAMLLLAGRLADDPDRQHDTRADLRQNALAQGVVRRLLELYQNDPDPGIHAAAEWALGQFGQRDAIVRQEGLLIQRGLNGDYQWYVNRQGHTMVVVPGPAEFLMGAAGAATENEQPHYARIRRSFCIASTETTVRQFRRFLEDNPWARRQAGAEATTAELPQTAVTWYEAAAYCNWLSKMGNLPEEEWCYETNEAGQYASGMKLRPDFLNRRGYRLPTEAEWEYACRAGATTYYAFGDDHSCLPHYAVNSPEAAGRPGHVATRMPNDFGLFDMHGNVAEWCQDRQTTPGKIEDVSSTAGPDYQSPIGDTDRMLMRGGSFFDSAKAVGCAARDRDLPGRRRITTGFRVARSFP